jgi:hypothetical protein
MLPLLLLQSVYGIARTMFLACLLAAGAMLIHQDTFRLVLQPVQRMVERVREMAEDPLMQAAVRISPAPALPSSSGAAGTDSASNSNSGSAAAPTNLLSKEQQPAAAAGSDGSGWSAKLSPQHSSRPSRMSRIRFWPSVQVHAVAEDAAEEPGGLQPPSADASSRKPAAFAQLQLQQRQSARVSGAQMLLAGTRRISLGVAAGVSAAGAVAARMGQQLRARTSAMRALVLGGGGDSEEEAAQGQYETRLLEQSIYKICALLAVGFGDAGAEVIAENIKKEGDLNPIVPGKKMVRGPGAAWIGCTRDDSRVCCGVRSWAAQSSKRQFCSRHVLKCLPYSTDNESARQAASAAWTAHMPLPAWGPAGLLSHVLRPCLLGADCAVLLACGHCAGCRVWLLRHPSLH